ncbi:MAG: phenylalanine--tRNA ligase subunit alpha [Deltaproteobacteria bacterium]|nr:phenylalanine--tRNA ligase subunit alpha [Deltaproteobacteria bacterium]
MVNRLQELESRVRQDLGRAGDLGALEALQFKVLGRKGELTQLLRHLGELTPEERPAAGQEANRVKGVLEKAFEERRSQLSASGSGPAAGMIDWSLPGRRGFRGRRHPITQTLDEVCGIFSRLNFEIVEGPEIELDYYNFEALNIPPDHPARDMQDTFYISEGVLLRTQTSPMQVRVMESRKPPLQIVSPGKVYRRDSDVSHSPMFHQVEGLMVGEGISFGDLKGILTLFVRRMFGEDTPLRFRPSFFPFTEPSAEVDIGCVLCQGGGCRLCSRTGWLEILGSGMVDPEVYRFVHYDPEQVTGFAFGLGIERIAMLKYGIDDIRMFYENDQRFLNQF